MSQPERKWTAFHMSLDARSAKKNFGLFQQLMSEAIKNAPSTVKFTSPDIEELEREVERLNRVIAQELSENDELGAEYTYVNSLKAKLAAAEAEMQSMQTRQREIECEFNQENAQLEAKLQLAVEALRFTLKGLEMWRKYQSPGNVAEVEQKARETLEKLK